RIAGIVDRIGVVARTAGHLVGAGQAVELVVAAVAGDDVVKGVASAVDARGAGQREVLDIVGEHIGGARVHGIGAFAGKFGDRVEVVVDTIGVVAGAARHDVGA